MDERYVMVKGVWKYFYCAVDKEGKTVDFLLTAKSDKAAANRFFDKAMSANGMPERATIDKSGANKAAVDAINEHHHAVPLVIRQIPQQHRSPRPSCSQTHHPNYVRIQILLVSQECLGRHRTHAHDWQRSAHDRWRK